MRSWTDIKNFYKNILSNYNANKRIALQPAAGRFFLRIGIGGREDLTAPLPHHPACGSAPGGSKD
jgi:hypothetical protein